MKEAGCRKDSSTLVGRMKVNAKPDTRRKAQKSTGSTIAQNGTKSDSMIATGTGYPRCNRRLSPGTAGKWEACGWSVAHLDYDEELVPLRWMYGSMEAKYEVQRTIRRAELTAFLCLLKKVTEPIKVRVDNKGIIDGPWRGERKCIAELWMKICGESHG